MIGTMASDTSNEAREAQYAAYRRMAPAERVQLAARMSEDARSIAKAGLSARHPELSEAELHEAHLRTLLGNAVYVRMRLYERR
jgi:hypothetical protein